MTKLTKKWFKDFLFSNMDDAEINNPGVDHIPYFDNGKWKNGDTSKILLMSPKVLNREIFVPANRTVFFGSFRSNGFRIKVEGRLRVM